MPTPSGALADTINTKLTTLWQALRTRQATYKTNNGRYWQGLRTAAVVPADGTTVPTDISLKPTDQTLSWTDFGLNLPATMEVQLQCDTYNGPMGDGYVLTATINITTARGTQTWQRAQAFGPEQWRTYGWTRINGPDDA